MRTLMEVLRACLFLVPALAWAGPHYVSSRDWGSFIWMSTYLEAGKSYTFETRELTGTTPDTVMHILRDRNGWSQVAMGDDCQGNTRSCVTFTAPDTGYYQVWVRAYAEGRGGTASVYRNDTLLLSNQPFGGVPLQFAWNAKDTFRASSTTPNGGDHLVFLLRSNSEYLQHDDDSGPRSNPFITAASTQNAGAQRVVVGRYPGSSGTATFIHDEELWSTIFDDNDGDEDGLSDSLEPLLNLSPNNDDSDGDGISDTLETFGNDGFSFAEWGSPSVRDLYVEVDWMAHPTNPYLTRQPYPELAADATSVFARDAGLRLHVFVDGAVPWSEVVCYGACPDGVNFYSIKQASFSSSNPERRPYFHYALFAYRHTSLTGCSSGKAELLGNDVIVSLGCWSSPSAYEQRGTFIHELGHNLNLDHNGNDVSGQFSVVHNSVMNYRYQFPGVSNSGWHSYSYGVNGCESCGTSPKARCVTCRSGFLGCNLPGCGSCDCDVGEWGSLVLDFSDDEDASDGSGPGRSQARSALANLLPDDKGGPARFVPRVPHEEPPVEKRREAVRRQRERLLSRGRVEGRDFQVSADGTMLYAECL
ncbi:hypothetical protein LZ198_41020 [Myxococcus sp. K15C18031901]|uniref:hypothetical protein n=1 Tax=Myxococcus dinghuensis TaxID=2906761 RepID=UPI0020A74870|nr:hypothetical protein [Myxococcus dinghuensis]MCP3105270.1 hypothetical protein [Myxococcus dinghuensis]